jgi:P-type conjugative transfer protein TrbJ
VFDPTNYSQNMLTAARTLQQINQQIQQLQNEARCCSTMDKNLSRIDFPELDRSSEKISAIDRLMGQARGVDFKVDQLDERFASSSPMTSRMR